MWSLHGLLLWALTANVVRAATIITHPSADLNLPSLMNFTSALHDDRIPFQTTVWDAVRDTMREYPLATLVKIEASTGIVEAVHNPEMLTDVRIIFTIPNRAPYPTLTVQMTPRWARWGTPQLSRLGPPRDSEPLPTSLRMDVVEADRLIKQHGYTQKYLYVDILLPTGIDQVLYLFDMDPAPVGTPNVVVVFTRDRRVYGTFNWGREAR